MKNRNCFLFMLAFLVVVILTSCHPVKKAIKTFDANRPEAAKYCDSRFPLIIITDSSAYKKSLAVIDSLIKLSQYDKFLSLLEREGLIQRIDSLKSIAPEECDSLYESLYRLAADAKREADILRKRNIDLVNAAHNIKPVHDTVENTKRVEVLQNANNQLSRNISDLSEQRDRLQEFRNRMHGKVHIPWWWLVIAGGIGYLTFRFRNLLKFKI